jgi:Ca-activated chloride channel family protein
VAATLMSLESPWMLLCLACVPALILAYVRILRVRAERAARLASEGLVPTVAARWVGWRRHVPFTLFATALALVCFALARPTVSLALPQREGTVILAFDVSNSMRAKDLEPTRIGAAKTAAIAFAKRQPRSIRIGVVAFGDSAVTVLRPTNVTADVIAAIKRLGLGGGTALGQGIYTSLNAIAGKKLKIDASALQRDAGTVKIGFYGSSAIVLLSDGENTSRPDPVKLAEVASTAGVPIHTIGLGTKEGTTVEINGFNVATALDEDLLKQIADVTDGTYHRAGDAKSLAQIYKSIKLERRNVEKPREASALFASGAGLLLVLGSGLSLAWFGRVI